MKIRRFLLSFLALSVICSYGIAEQPKRAYHIIDFSNGLNSHISPQALKDNQASEVRNVRFNMEYTSVSKRLTQLTYGSASSAVTGLHRYYNSDAVKRLIRADSTFLYVGNDDTGAWTTIGTGFTDGKWWSFVTYDDVAIGTNGYDQPIKYDGKILNTANTDGHRTAGYLVAELGAPFVELNTGTTMTAARYFSYMVVHYDGTTYTYSTARSNPILTGADVRSLYLTNIPIGPTGTTHRYIFRSPAHTSVANCIAEADADFLMVKDLADNSTVVWADDVAVSSEPDSPNWGTVSAGTDITPPLARYALVNNNRLFLAGDPSNPSYLYWSDEYNPDYFSIIDYYRIREDDGDDITFLRNQLGVMIVGKTNTIQKFHTDAASDADWYPSDPFSHVGCPAPYSVADSPYGIIYLGRGGIYIFNGRNSKLISDAVTPEIQDILETNYDEVSGMYWENEYHMAYTSLSADSAINDRVLVHDAIRDAYTLDYKNVNRWCVFDGGTDYGILYAGGSDSTGIVYAQSGSPKLFLKRYKSDMDAGTFDDTRSLGTEDAPILELAWDCTIDGWLTELETKDANITTIDSIVTYLADAIIDRPDTDGTWVSPGYQINAEQLDKLYWNEDLGTYGDITVQIRLASTEAGLSSASYGTAYTNPSGSDISGVTVNDWIQVRFNLSTSDIDYTPNLVVADNYFLKMDYSKRGTSYEPAFLARWVGGWEDFGTPAVKKHIRRIKVYYTGTSGTLTIGYKGDDGDIDETFDIDMGITPPYTETDTGNKYQGDLVNKIYTFYTSDNSAGYAPISQFWMFSISEESVSDTWSVQKIEVVWETSILD